MGLYDELAAGGRGGQLLIDILSSVMAQVTRTSSFPPPEGFSSWDDGAVQDAVAQLFADKPNFVKMCWARAHDDRTLELVFLRTIKNFLIDQAKGTDTGKLRRRLQGLVTKDAYVTAGKLPAGEDAWWLAAGPATPWAGHFGDLERAAGKVRGVRVETLNPAGPTPAGTVAALMSVVHAVLSAAGGAVRAQDVTRVVERRFGLSTRPATRPLFAGDPVERIPAVGVSPEVAATIEAAAEEIWGSLDQVERAICPHLKKSHEEVGEILGMGPDETIAVLEWLYAKMKLGCEDTEDVEAIVSRAMQLCAERP